MLATFVGFCWTSIVFLNDIARHQEEDYHAGTVEIMEKIQSNHAEHITNAAQHQTDVDIELKIMKEVSPIREDLTSIQQNIKGVEQNVRGVQQDIRDVQRTLQTYQIDLINDLRSDSNPYSITIASMDISNASSLFCGAMGDKKTDLQVLL